MKIEEGETYTRNDGRGKPKSRTVTAVSGTSVFWRKANGTRIHKTQRKAFEYWLHHGTSMYQDQRKQKDIENNYRRVDRLDKSVLKILRESGVRHKHHNKQLFIHKDDYKKAKPVLFGALYGGKTEYLKTLLEEA